MFNAILICISLTNNYAGYLCSWAEISLISSLSQLCFVCLGVLFCTLAANKQFFVREIVSKYFSHSMQLLCFHLPTVFFPQSIYLKMFMNLIQFLLCAFIFILCKEWMFNYMSSACPPLSMCINLVGLKLALKGIRGTKVVRKVKAGSWDGGFMFHKILQGEMVGRQGVASKQNEEGEGRVKTL